MPPVDPPMSAPQRRLLRAVRDGQREFNGRVLQSAKKLEREGVLRIVSKRKIFNRTTGGNDWHLIIEEAQ